MGRPSLFTAELAAAICERISLGESLRKITSDEGMPAKLTVLRWLSQDESFRTQYARARDDQADAYAEDIIDIADDEPDPVRARVRVDARKWVAAKLKPKKYGERQTIDHEGNVNLGIVQVPLPAGGINEWLALTSSGSPAADPSTSS